MFDRIARTNSFIAIVSASMLASAAQAQPADRPAAFTQGIAVATPLAPAGSRLVEANLEQDDGRWVLEFEFYAGLISRTEIKLDATTFQQIEIETRPQTSGEVARSSALQAVAGTITTTFTQAIGIAATRTPAGFAMTEIELEIQSGVPVYQFDFYNANDQRSRVLVNATSGAPSIPGGGGGGGGGGGTPTTITLQQAIDIALQRYPGASVLETEYDSSDAKWEIKLLVGTGSAAVIRRIDLTSAGALIKDEIRNGSRDDKAEDRLRNRAIPSTSITLAQAAQVALLGNPGFSLVSAEWEREGGVAFAKIVLTDSVGPKIVYVTPQGSIRPAPSNTPPVNPAPAITFDLSGAINAAQAAVPGGVIVEIELEQEGGRWIYEVNIAQAAPVRLTQVLVDARTSRVIGQAAITPGPRYLQKINGIIANRSQITRTFARAQSAALALVGAGYIRSIELESRDSGGFEYEVEVIVDGKEFKVSVDARSAEVAPR